MCHTINMALLLPSVCFHSIYCAYFHHAYLYFIFISVCLLHIRLWLKHFNIFLPKYGETRYNRAYIQHAYIYVCLLHIRLWLLHFDLNIFLPCHFYSSQKMVKRGIVDGLDFTYVTASYWYFPCYFHSSFEHPKTGEMRYCLDLLSYSKETEIFQTLFTWTMHCIHLSVCSTSIYDCFTFVLILIYSSFKH